MITGRCIDGLPHQFRFLRRVVKDWRNEDIFFCQKCLAHRAVAEGPKPEDEAAGRGDFQVFQITEEGRPGAD